ncbi:HAD family hydrolase [Salinibacter altiplanensis]|uniref:HAD family hydrolase n=1 Tax=Salinibacter altiplanensis TaxID=1803181 RepID=UPI001F2BAB99|nr:HAD hydrolase family protein [Salinibacter altiplanensis]
MTKLFIADIDGCLAAPYEAYDLAGLNALRRLPQEADTAPALTLCSGRSYPYVEAMTQALNLTTPVLFEAGGGQFDPVAAQTAWSPHLTDAVEAKLRVVEDWFMTECVPGTQISLDHAKRTQTGVVSPEAGEIRALRPRTEQFVAEETPGLHVFATDISVDVVPPGITKRDGVEWLANRLDLALDEMAYIGDAETDLEALDAVGTSFAPANADPAVQARVDHVTDGTVLDGTLEAYRYCRAQNAA